MRPQGHWIVFGAWSFQLMLLPYSAVSHAEMDDVMVKVYADKHLCILITNPKH